MPRATSRWLGSAFSLAATAALALTAAPASAASFHPAAGLSSVKINDAAGLSSYDLGRRVLVQPAGPAAKTAYQKDGQWILGAPAAGVKVPFELARVTGCGPAIAAYSAAVDGPKLGSAWALSGGILMFTAVNGGLYAAFLQQSGDGEFKGELTDMNTGASHEATLSFVAEGTGVVVTSLGVGANATPFVGTFGGTKRFYVPDAGATAGGARITHAASDEALLCSHTGALTMMNDEKSPTIASVFRGFGPDGEDSMLLSIAPPAVTRRLPHSHVLSILRHFEGREGTEPYSMGLDYFFPDQVARIRP